MTIIKQTAFPSGSPPENLSAYTTAVGGGFQGDVTAYTINPSGTLLCSGDSYQNVYGDENPATADYQVTASVSLTASSAGIASMHVGPLIRASNGGSGLNGYFAAIRGDGSMVVGRYNAGNRVELANYAAGLTAANTYSLRLRAEGTGAAVTLTTFLDDVEVTQLAASDTAAERVVAAGNGGLYSRSNNTYRAEAYSLLVEDLAGGGGAVPVVSNVVVADTSLIDTLIGSVTITATDSDGSVVGYAVTYSTTPPTVSQSATATFNFTLPDYGTYNVYGWAMDDVGNWSVAVAPVFVHAVDSTAFGTSSIYPFNGGFVA